MMDMVNVYGTLRWELARTRAIERDRALCTVSRLLGGDCTPGLDVHHIRPLSEGGAPFELENLATVCDGHHPMWEALRRNLLRVIDRDEERPPRCNHQHRTIEARELCEARMRRQRERASVAA